jgi:hypothetical protein
LKVKRAVSRLVPISISGDSSGVLCHDVAW